MTEVVQPGRGRPELSVLMPVHEQERFVAEAIRSVLAQRDVVLEVIVSDDASSDGTFAAARAALQNAPPEHRILLRRGTPRLRRDHVAALLDIATCDIVLLAHGDDRSRPHRARRLLDVLGATGASLVGSEATTIDTDGRTTDVPPEAGTPLQVLESTDVLAWSTWVLSGQRAAWRRNRLQPFGRLDSTVAGCGHDVVTAFRASLSGPTVAVTEPLVERRDHAGAWSRAVADWRSEAAGTVGIGLYWLTALRAMRSDVELARSVGIVDDATATRLRVAIDDAVAARTTAVLDAHDELQAAGKVPLWVDDAELALGWQGDDDAVRGVIRRAIGRRRC